MNKLILYSLALTCSHGFSYAAERNESAIDCNPVVQGVQAKTLKKALSLLAEKYKFELIFADDMDRPVESVNSMGLSQALKYLTTGVSTVLQHEKVTGCENSKLVSMEVLPIGENSSLSHVKPTQAAQAGPAIIEDMALYAEEVLLKQRKPDRGMTPEQRKEYIKMKIQVRERLEAEGLIESRAERRKRKKKNKQKNKRKKSEREKEKNQKDIDEK